MITVQQQPFCELGHVTVYVGIFKWPDRPFYIQTVC